MIELRHDQLTFSFPDVHPEAKLRIQFQRTLRIPDDDQEYFLPPGLGRFPLRHVDDHSQRVPSSWIERGGVMLPMYQSEAMWLNFDSPMLSRRWTGYPFAVQVATGKINAVSGEPWSGELQRDPQGHMVVPGQPWLDGYAVEKGVVRQFVAMPLGAGYTAEEQVTGEAAFGGLQIQVRPMRREVFDRRFPLREAPETDVLAHASCEHVACLDTSMGLAPGGRMRQEIYEDEFDLEDWSADRRSRCFVHLANSLTWRAITGAEPPTTPMTATEYERAGLPWFDYYSERPATEGSPKLKGLESVGEMGQKKGDAPLPENESVQPKKVVRLREGLRPHQVREWT